MDPNQALANITYLAAEHQERGLATREVDELAEQITDLNRWLRNGGFLPSVWQR